MSASSAPSAARPNAVYDAVIVGGGHNGLVSAAYLARAGLSVLLLERLDHTGGAAVSDRAFEGVDARLSRYSYLVSLLPGSIVRDLGLDFSVRGRSVASYTPVRRDGRDQGLLVTDDAAHNRRAFAELTGSDREFESWQRFYGRAAQVARRVFPTLTEPLPNRSELRRRLDDDRTWEEFFERPIGESIERHFADDLVRGVVLTDALIGTFSHAHDPSLRQNRCFLYHVIGGGTGDWNVPVGGMGALTDALAASARAAGAELATGHEVTAVATDGREAEVTFRTREGEGRVAARYVLSGAAPAQLDSLLGAGGPAGLPVGAPLAGPDADEGVEGAQLKVNMLLRRLPRLRDRRVDPRQAFAGTFHIAEGYEALEHAYRQAASGVLPSAPPSEIYCHSLTDPSILGPEPAREGYQTLTLFGLHAPARLFRGTDEAAVREELCEATLAQLQEHLDEPLSDCLATDAAGRPCLEVKTPLDLERDLRMPGGHIFHRDLAFPYAPDPGTTQPGGPATQPGDPAAPQARWGVATGSANVLLCGAGAVRGGGVSGIPGHNAARALLELEARSAR
ncbi:NAD(P)/FAD-dependent oxidoreductase [Streptomyces sp. P38-E01]|uniref:Pyridine nucleotide-disulfide oxidoreductase domain-containing protein 2 n=1 Tax=Streptomyces tardus TaxID=2780544 RepID=A0A949JK36_9ACTN|nr:NAD(P)/FAD-dependent oxidoreductase [Streptomyces tardus]MBU7600165.1 NAD(P)/FAD-dependent oxidoreductase [Streptomyces tardus]